MFAKIALGIFVAVIIVLLWILFSIETEDESKRKKITLMKWLVVILFIAVIGSCVAYYLSLSV